MSVNDWSDDGVSMSVEVAYHVSIYGG